MRRVAHGGTAIAIEVWEMPSLELGSFITTIPSPLALGKVELANGAWVTGFFVRRVWYRVRGRHHGV
jgi:allophanate hydrolase